MRTKIALISVVMAAASACTAPPVSVGLLPPQTVAVAAGQGTGFAFGVAVMQACSATGGPVSVTLASYVDPFGAETAIATAVSRLDHLGGSVIETVVAGYQFTGVGDEVVSPSIPPGCFAVSLTAFSLCVEPQYPGCLRAVWPGATAIVDW